MIDFSLRYSYCKDRGKIKVPLFCFLGVVIFFFIYYNLVRKIKIKEERYMYRYEMHIHSEPCSGGGSDIIKEIDALRERGYAGMVITNHFYFGDTRIDRSLPWNEFVDAYRQDYERGKKYADELDFDVLFGIEEHVGDGLEVLVYGVTPDFLEENTILMESRVEDYIRLVHEAGGMLFQSHPYRDRYYINTPGPLPCLEELDGIEVYNAANHPEENELARELADRLGLKCVAGSDAHSLSSCGKAGIDSPERLRTGEDLVRILKSGNYKLYTGE